MPAQSGYGFLPYLRRGVSTEIGRKNDDVVSTAQPRATIAVSLAFKNLQSATVQGLALVGPGEVTGLDPRAVIRTWPAPDIANAESNLFPFIEFSQADLPWRYTPAMAGTNAHLRPWFCLIALKEAQDAGEIEAYETASSDQAMAVVTVTKDAPLPLLAQSWAWAHVQVTGDKEAAKADVAEYLRSEPHRVVARLLCPRALKPRTPYVALLVPTFQRGVLAGLGQAAPDSVDGMAPAWAAGQRTGSVKLPVLYRWRFQTGEGGDFEALVSRLQQRVMPEGVGLRLMDVGDPGLGLPAASSEPLGVEGALKAPAMTSSPWIDTERDNWIEELSERLSGQEELVSSTPPTSRQVALPTYGRWHASLTDLTLVAPPALPWPWAQELNADPRLRAVAGLGGQVVQAQREQLMDSAWRQVEEIRRINEELRLAQLAREAAHRIYARHLVTADTEALLTLAAPLHGRIGRPTATAALTTVAAEIRRSPIDAGVLDPQWRRLARKRGPIGRRQGRRSSDVSTLLDRLNRGEVVPAPAPETPSGMNAFSSAGLDKGTMNPTRLGTVPASGGFVPVEYPSQSPVPDGPPGEPVNPTTVSDEFGTAILDLFTDLAVVPAKPPARKPVDLVSLRKAVENALNPDNTMTTPHWQRLQATQAWNPRDKLEPVMAAPEFPQPMFAPLRDLSQEWVLPGLQHVPPDTMSLLETNQRFVEAYMLGLNYEMARQLLWNEYPTDQRGTYFRQFWDVTGHVPKANTTLGVDDLKDITLITEWAKASELGSHSPGKAGTSGNVVLLIRGDLLRRYPTAILYATKAKFGAGNKPEFDLSGEERHPIFNGTLRPDVSYFGFDLTKAAARGNSSDAGWYFVLQERPGEPRFGLDEGAGGAMTDWLGLNWGHMGSTVTYIDLTTSVPTPTKPGGLTWGNQSRSSDLAAITFQPPVRVGIHASRMLPP